jgi:protein gp37
MVIKNKMKVKFKYGSHDYPFNFWIGCHRFSEGCKNCYMFNEQKRRTIELCP